MQSGLISKDELAHKYQNEIHANEIVLLAYYIAAINIEAVYHSIMGGEYQPFNGICLTDTFQLHEKEDLVSMMMEANSSRRKKQKALDIRVIIGNPPYSAGQKSENDDNQNIEYPKLDASIRNTYAKHSTATLQKNLYDSYVRAIRWASDRIGNSGVIGFVSNASFIDGNSMDGLRKCLADEFSSIYVFHLRGNQRTSGELSRQEGGKIFGGGSRAPIAISVLIKNPNAKEQGRIFIHDIGEYLTREDKLGKIGAFKSIDGITKANGWLPITPDKHHDWIGQRDDSFSEFISLGDKKDKGAVTVFEDHSQAVLTSRDAWCYNFSKAGLESNLQRMIGFYNSEMQRYRTDCEGIQKSQYPKIDKVINNDPSKISWSGNVKANIGRFKKLQFNHNALNQAVYRPFTKAWVYFDKDFNERRYQMPRIFPDHNKENIVISVIGRGATKDFCAFITDTLPDYEMISKGQSFPLKLYEKSSLEDELSEIEDTQNDMFASSEPEKEKKSEGEYTVKDGITDEGLAHFQAAYPKETITKEDVFYFFYVKHET